MLALAYISACGLNGGCVLSEAVWKIESPPCPPATLSDFLTEDKLKTLD
jgi:hypothetical protein